MKAFVFLCVVAVVLAQPQGQRQPGQAQQQAPVQPVQGATGARSEQPIGGMTGAIRGGAAGATGAIQGEGLPGESNFDEAADVLMHGSVLQWTNGLYSALQSMSMQQIAQFFDSSSTLNYLGHDFEGEEIGMFAFLMQKTIQLDAWNYQILAVDETKLSSIVKITGSGTFLKTAKRLPQLSQIHVLTWGPAIVNDMTIIDTNLNATLSAALPKCELQAWSFLWSIYAGKEVSTSAPAVTRYISPQYNLKIHIFPETLLQQNEFNGIEGFVDAFRAVSQLGMMDQVKNERVEFKVLYSDDSSVFVELELPDNMVFKNISCLNGQFVKEEVFVVNPVLPWNILPTPTVEGVEGGEQPIEEQPQQPQQPMPQQGQQQQQQPPQPQPGQQPQQPIRGQLRGGATGGGVH